MLWRGGSVVYDSVNFQVMYVDCGSNLPLIPLNIFMRLGRHLTVWSLSLPIFEKGIINSTSLIKLLMGMK